MAAQLVSALALDHVGVPHRVPLTLPRLVAHVAGARSDRRESDA